MKSYLAWTPLSSVCHHWTITKETLFTCEQTLHSFLPLIGSPHLHSLSVPLCTPTPPDILSVIFPLLRHFVELLFNMLTIIDRHVQTILNYDRLPKNVVSLSCHGGVILGRKGILWLTLSLFHYLLTFRVARQPHSIIPFDFKCGLLTGMKNAYLAKLLCFCVRGRTRWENHGSWDIFLVQKYRQVYDYNRICWVMNSSTNLNVPYTEHSVKMNNDSLCSQHKGKP